MENLTKDERKALRKLEWQEELKKEQQGKLVKSILTWVIVIACLGAGFWFLIASSGTSPSSNSNSSAISLVKAKDLSPISQNDFTKGNKNAKVTLIEYADFQCPGCGIEYPILKQLESTYANKMLFVYRFFPLKEIHKNAILSAQAAYAASLQNKFWEMHDLLFDNQNEWSESNNALDIFVKYAKTLNLDISKFTQDIKLDSTNKVIDDNYNSGVQAGVESTPSLFLNGNKIVTSDKTIPTFDQLKKLIDQKLKGK